jgi:ER lumen protein retaining receptor
MMNIFRLTGNARATSEQDGWLTRDRRPVPRPLHRDLASQDALLQRAPPAQPASLLTLSQSASGISFKSQFLYFLVYSTRYLDLLWTFFLPSKLYLTVFKIFFISSSAYIVYLMVTEYKPTHDPNQDTFRVEFLLGAAAALALIFPYSHHPTEMLWAFSIWLESVAVLPQLFMLQRTGEAETITTHYLFALGAYRALYIPNWVYRWMTEPNWYDPIAVIAGIIQTILYSDFFWVYYTKCVPSLIRGVANVAGSCKARSSTSPFDFGRGAGVSLWLFPGRDCITPVHRLETAFVNRTGVLFGGSASHAVFRAG